MSPLIVRMLASAGGSAPLLERRHASSAGSPFVGVAPCLYGSPLQFVSLNAAAISSLMG